MYLPRKNVEQKAKELQKDRRILKQSNDRLLKMIDKLAVKESVEINSETSDVIISVINKYLDIWVKSLWIWISTRFTKTSFVGTAKETLPIEERVINAMKPSNDLMVFEFSLKVTRWWTLEFFTSLYMWRKTFLAITM